MKHRFQILWLICCLILLRMGVDGAACYIPRIADWQVQGEFLKGNRPCMDDNMGKIGALGFTNIINRQFYMLFDGTYIQDHKNEGASIGLGARGWLFNGCALGGMNLYYDYWNAHVGGVHQLGVGFELLSQWADLRLNLYYPLSSKTRFGKVTLFDDYIGPYWVKCQKRYSLANKLDFELGKQWNCFRCFGIDVAVGGYRIDFHHGSDIFGVKGRVRLRYQNLLYLESNVYHDHECHSKADIRIGFQVSLCQLCDCLTQLHQPVIRRNYLPTTRCCHYEKNF